VRNDRLSRFLRFVVEQHLEGKEAELKESLVGIEVFGRRPGYDPRQDSVVRTEAAKLRTRLAKYYAGEGATDTIVIDLPKGGYSPVFREAGEEREKPASGLESTPSRLQKRLWLAVALAGIVAVAAVTGRWWIRHRARPFRLRFYR
jgi:serine/threonine-protein kinase